MSNNSYTRGSGLLEGFLAKQRAGKANSFISKEHRKGRILDIGCGTYPYFLVTTLFKEKYGIDPSVNTLLGKDKNLTLKKFRVDGKELPFKDNFFDAVTMLAVFEHIEQERLIDVLKEIRRVLKDNGILIITTPSPWADKLLHFMAIFGLISKEEIHEHKHNHQKSRIEDIINQAEFDKNAIKSGFFEMRMNMWFTAIK